MDATKYLLIRPAQPEDLPAIYDLMTAYDMVGKFATDRCVIAEREDRLIGFARVEVADGKSYLRPIVVDRQNQDQGIGKALLQHILSQMPCLTVISRGSATGFYERMGFEFADWNEIHLLFKNECAACPDLKTCKPVPMRSLNDFVKVNHPK